MGVVGSSTAQMSYFNEWYRPGQSYVKFRIPADGLYRVKKADLQAAGVANLGTISSSNIQLFYRGVEVPVYLHDSLNGNFDYLEFLGRRNDGALDSLLYRKSSDRFQHDPTLQPNIYTSIFSDTSAYFLTWDSGNTQRMRAIAPHNFGAYVPETHYRYRALFEFMYVPFIGGGGSSDIYNVLNPDYVTGEGWMSNEVTYPNEVANNFITPGYIATGNLSHVDLRVMGTNDHPQHIFSIFMDQTQVYRDTSAYVNIATYGFDLASMDSVSKFRFGPQGSPSGNIPDRQCVAWVAFTYDHDLNLKGGKTTVVHAWSHTDSSYLRFYHADVDTAAWLYDPLRQERIAATVSGDTLHFLVPGDNAARELYLFTDRALSPAEIIPTPALDNLSDVAAGAEMVIVTHRKFSNSAQQYATYRSTNNVNRLSCKVVYIDEIYDEFGYGTMTPWAIKNFCRYALEQWTVKPKHFLLWGKGRNCPRCDNSDNYVPTFGTPATDWEYVTNMSYDSTNLVPAAGLGRVTLFNDQHGLDYLAKVMDFESQPYANYYKNVLMMGGGKSSGEQASIYSANVERMMPLVTGEPMDGRVYYYQKRNNGFETNTPGVTTEQHINDGLGILHFFGHSAVNIFELDILDPSRYTNEGKYPFMIAFGCSGGNFNEPGLSYGERMILEPGKGSIAYLGNTTSGFLHTLPQYGDALYNAMMREQYGASLGEIFQATLEDFCRDNLAFQNIFAQNHAKQLALQGDPSVHLKFPLKPDLRVADADIYFPEGSPQAMASTFKLNLILHNDGRSFADSFGITIQQRLPSGQTITHPLVYFQPFANIDTLELTLPNVNGLLSAGTNVFTASVDLDNVLDELIDTLNNIAQTSQLFIGTLATPLFPAEYAIVGEQTLFLQASMFVMNNALPQSYAFEIDTVSTFDSPFIKNSGTVQGTAALGEWPIGFNLTPGQVYYWRTRLADFWPAQWIASSFKYVPGRTGWSQSRLQQMTKDQGRDLRLDMTNRGWEFGLRSVILHALIQVTGKASYFLGVHGSQGEAGSGVLYTVIDQHTLDPIVHGPSTYGDWQFTPAPGAGPSGIMNVVSMIASMQDGDYFLLASSSNPHMPNWPDAAIQAFELVGAKYSDIRAMADGERLLILGRKGAVPGTAIVYTRPNFPLPSDPSPVYDLLQTLSAPLPTGSVQSTIIGPSTSWQQLEFGWGSLDVSMGDSLRVGVYGIAVDGSESLLISDLDSGRHQLAAIDARTYAQLRLQGKASDHIHYSAPQLQRWEVYHAAVADLAIDASLHPAIPDTITEGERLHLRVFVRNITSVPTDSVWVRFAFQKTDRSFIELGRQKYGAFQAKEVKQIMFDASSTALGLEPGTMTLVVEVNPDQAMPEQYHFNNIYYRPIWIETDQTGPLVDVLIDGRHLMGGDIVSPEPEIVIQINDENAYLPVTVSDSTFRIWFGTERAYRTNPMVTIETSDSIEKSPVRMPENKTRLTFRPGRLPDGEYTLAVQGYDLKGNEAGARPYVIQINVVNQKSISEVLPYPNPFSSACHFAFTLTGDEKPSRFDIEIYTITGKLVKVVDLLALGDVHFGHNVTQYAWDGRDEYGDLLANGVYIYKVNTRFIDQGAIKLRDEGISDFFKNGYGKMYLMR
jgi:Peptidase family C25